MTDKRTITVTVNGTKHTKEAPVRITLADFLRHELRQTGTHVGCEHGICGACTVLVDGRAVRSCFTLYAVQVEGCEITTVEGVNAGPDPLSDLSATGLPAPSTPCNAASARPGMLTTLLEFLRDNPDPTEQEVRVAISGNLCRCTGYQGIVLAALDAAKRMKAAAKQA